LSDRVIIDTAELAGISSKWDEMAAVVESAGSTAARCAAGASLGYSSAPLTQLASLLRARAMKVRNLMALLDGEAFSNFAVTPFSFAGLQAWLAKVKAEAERIHMTEREAVTKSKLSQTRRDEIVRRALAGKTEYPDRDGVFDLDMTARRFYTRNCTDFVAWALGMKWSDGTDRSVTPDGLEFRETYRDAVGKLHVNGNASGWNQSVLIEVTDPKPGDVAFWGASDGKGAAGHVAVVTKVNHEHDKTTVQIADYNSDLAGNFGTHDGVTAPHYLRLPE